MIPYSAFMSDLKGKLAYKRSGKRKKRGITSGPTPLDGLSS
jgi:hypothetical protein